MKSKMSNEIVLPPGAPKGFVARRVSGTPLTSEQKRRARALAAMPDESIDFSDLPPWTEEIWKNAARSPWYRPVKKQLTVRVDADVLAWLKGKGAGYQTRINALLREAMLAERGRG
jgi:uncharacterized protein (DUF4415 family)